MDKRNIPARWVYPSPRPTPNPNARFPALPTKESRWVWCVRERTSLEDPLNFFSYHAYALALCGSQRGLLFGIPDGLFLLEPRLLLLRLLLQFLLLLLRFLFQLDLLFFVPEPALFVSLLPPKQLPRQNNSLAWCRLWEVGGRSSGAVGGKISHTCASHPQLPWPHLHAPSIHSASSSSL